MDWKSGTATLRWNHSRNLVMHRLVSTENLMKDAARRTASWINPAPEPTALLQTGPITQVAVDLSISKVWEGFPQP